MFASPRTPRTRRQAFLNSPFAHNNSTLGASMNSSALQTSYIQETPSHVLESFGHTLPVHIVESILSIDNNAHVSVVISESAWIWLVIRSKLLIWQYSKKTSTKTCYSLELANSILMHQANLCHINENPVKGKWSKGSGGVATPNCMVVSPMGVVRYWPNISHEGVYTENIIDLAGEECFSLTYLGDSLYIVATTTGSLIKVVVLGSGNAVTLDAKKVRVQQGVLKEIGKRVSSFIFGAMPIAGENRQARKLLAGTDDCVYILFENALQCWEGWEVDNEVARYDVELDIMVKEAYRAYVWNTEATADEDIICWCIDAQVCKEGLLVLMAAVNEHVSNTLHYSLAILNCRNPVELMHFTPLSETSLYSENNCETLLSAKCILPHGREVFVYNGNRICAVNLIDKKQDILQLNNDTILGCGSYSGLPLFLTHYNHLVFIQATGEQPTEPMVPEEGWRIAESFVDDDDSREGLLKRALLHFCRGEMAQSATVLDLVFPTLNTSGEVESLDITVVDLSRNLLDDVSAGDPRWGKTKGKSTTTTSMLVENQIADKLKVCDVYLQFLKVNGIWKRLKSVTLDRLDVPTRLALREHKELLVVAEGLQRTYENVKQVRKVMDSAIKRVIASRKQRNAGRHLTSRDLFYTSISKIAEVFNELQNCIEELVEQEDSEILNHIVLSNMVLVGALKNLKTVREDFALEEGDLLREYYPWSARVLRATLMKHHELSEEHALSHNFVDSEKRSTILEQMSEIAKVVLEDYTIHIKSLDQSAPKRIIDKVKQQMDVDRKKLIGAFIKSRHFDIAVVLAEGYFDFAYLVKICEETHNQEKLFQYMETFKEQNFSEFVFQYYLDSGNRAKLLKQPNAFNEQLSRFLQSHQNLNWLHCIRTDDFMKAGDSLHQLALKEERFLARKKLQVNLSKLCALASKPDDPNDAQAHQSQLDNFMQEINILEDVIAIQENLSKNILSKKGIDSEQPPVLKPVEMIRMIIESNSHRESDYKTALDLLDFTELHLEENETLRLEIWSKAVLQDEWDFQEGSNISDIMRDLLFFQIVELAFLQDLDLIQFMPDIEDLLSSPYLTEQKDRPSFEFVLRAGYEHIRKLLKSNDE